MKAEIKKTYQLDSNAIYFCPDIHREVKFIGPVVVECTNHFGETNHFGKLADLSSTGNGPDYMSDVEIEFSDDNIICEYELKQMPLMYMDFISCAQ